MAWTGVIPYEEGEEMASLKRSLLLEVVVLFCSTKDRILRAEAKFRCRMAVMKGVFLLLFLLQSYMYI